jgi:hypothetical protein
MVLCCADLEVGKKQRTVSKGRQRLYRRYPGRGSQLGFDTSCPGCRDY